MRRSTAAQPCPRPERRALTIKPEFFPALNAGLNGTTAVLLVTGHQLMQQGKIALHKRVMVVAVATSALFLSSYIYYHFHYRLLTRFQGQGAVRYAYFTLLTSHTILAALIVPMVLVTLSRGLRQRFDKHRAIARWTYPLWLYVSITGVLIYFMLYHWYA